MSPARLPRLTPPRRAAARPGPSPASCSADARGSSEFTCGGERRAWGRLAPSSPPRQEQCPASRDRRLDQRPVQLTPPRNRLLGVLQPRFPGRKKTPLPTMLWPPTPGVRRRRGRDKIPRLRAAETLLPDWILWTVYVWVRELCAHRRGVCDVSLCICVCL